MHCNSPEKHAILPLALLLGACTASKSVSPEDTSQDDDDRARDTAGSDSGRSTDTAIAQDSGHDADTSETAVEPYAYEPPDRTICDAVLDVENGFLCAIQPSRIDPEARDIFSSDSYADENLGFGYHVIAFPSAETAIEGVYVHFTGSMGRAYHPVSQTFTSQTLLNEAMGAGFITLQPAYHNRYAVNSNSECLGSAAVDNCAGLVRHEKITGEDVTSVVDVPPADSINRRMAALDTYTVSVGFAFPVSLSDGENVHWNMLRVGGHSQGSGHALYLHKYWGNGHTCLFGGPYDVADSVPSVPPEEIADWYLDSSVAVDISTVRALVSVDDTHYDSFVKAYQILGLEEGTHWMSFVADGYTDWEGDAITGHGAVVHDPNYSAQRHETCFAVTAE